MTDRPLSSDHLNVRLTESLADTKFRSDLLLALHIIAAAVTLLAGVGIGIMLSILSRG